MITIKSEEEIETMKGGGRILSGILERLAKEIKPGLATSRLEELANKLINETGTEPAFLGFNDYPAALCVSINDEVVHSIPSQRLIMPGDLVSLDLGIRHKGLNVDSAVTVLVEPQDKDPDYELKKKLIKATRECLNKGIDMARVGNTIGDISHAIQKHAREEGFSVIKDLVGHGIGRELHEEPEVPNFGAPGKGPVLKEGMVIAIEPMLSVGSPEVVEDKKTLAWKTEDGSLAAHFEHTVGIIKKGPVVLTE